VILQAPNSPTGLTGESISAFVVADALAQAVAAADVERTVQAYRRPSAAQVLSVTAEPMVMLFGESMLGRFTKPRILQLERELRSAATVYNCAAGGWDSSDCAPRGAVLARLAPAVVVISLGANDCAPWKGVPPGEFAENVATVVEAFRGSSVVGRLPPAIREVDGPGSGRRTHAELDRYREILRAAVGAAACVDVTAVLAGVDFAPLEDDGLHLTAESYATVIPAMARVVERGLPAGAASA
jgi:hypothetical protein